MRTILIFFAFSIVSALCGEKSSPAKETRFESRENGFSVVFLGEPKQKSQIQSSQWGNHQLHSYTYKVSPQLALIITCEELPATVREPAKTLQQSVRGAAILQKGTVTTASDTKHDGNPARDYVIDCGTLNYQGRYILVGRRLYNVAAFVSKKLGAEQPKEVKTFVDSFQILK